MIYSPHPCKFNPIHYYSDDNIEIYDNIYDKNDDIYINHNISYVNNNINFTNKLMSNLLSCLINQNEETSYNYYGVWQDFILCKLNNINLDNNLVKEPIYNAVKNGIKYTSYQVIFIFLNNSDNEIIFNNKKYNLNNLKNTDNDDSIFTNCTICLGNISISDIYNENIIGHEISEKGVEKLGHLVHEDCFNLWKTRNCENNLYCYCPYENKINKHTFKIVSEINDFSLDKISKKLHESCFTNIDTYEEQMKKILGIE